MSRYAVQPRILRAGHENLEETNVTGNDNLVTREPRAALRSAFGSTIITLYGWLWAASVPPRSRSRI